MVIWAQLLKEQPACEVGGVNTRGPKHGDQEGEGKSPRYLEFIVQ